MSPANGHDPYLPEPATILRNDPMTEMENLFEISLDSGRALRHHPGQFVEVSLAGFGEAPISVSSPPSENPVFQLGVRRAGSLTGAMHRLKPGDKIGVRGPFGKGFPMGKFEGRDVLFISGGCGLVPLRSAILDVLANRGRYGRVTILFGCKSPRERLYAGELGEWERRQDVTFLETVDAGDNGWTGNVGLITTLVPRVELDPAKTVAAVCGPPVMYKFVLKELAARDLPDERIYISLERRMKCGLGKCGHCQINGLTACQDGPVFRVADIRELAEAVA